jgi:YHS domain-containing protein
MSVDPDHAAAHRNVDGTDYYFCSEGCAGAFDAAPDTTTDIRDTPRRWGPIRRTNSSAETADRPVPGDSGVGLIEQGLEFAELVIGICAVGGHDDAPLATLWALHAQDDRFVTRVTHALEPEHGADDEVARSMAPPTALAVHGAGVESEGATEPARLEQPDRVGNCLGSVHLSHGTHVSAHHDREGSGFLDR